jgi:hypothetical protein
MRGMAVGSSGVDMQAVGAIAVRYVCEGDWDAVREKKKRKKKTHFKK